MDDDLREQIDAAGERRRQGLAIADSALNDVVDLVEDALDAGMSKADIADLAGISRLTLDAVLRRRSAEAERRAGLPGTAGELERALRRAA
jgi:transcriptional regulator GlxA family with amidase domain